MVTASAPGKVHLIGEHAVVYGEPAIIAAIDKRCRVSATKNADLVVRSTEAEAVYDLDEVVYFTKEIRDLWHKCADNNDFSEVFSVMHEDPFNVVKVAVGETLMSLNIDGGADIEMKTEIPIGMGLGSSAAFSVATAKALSSLYGKNLDKPAVNDIAYSIEKYVHGTPSGGDNTTCCYGGLLWFQKSKEGNIIRNLHYKLENFFLIYIGKPEKSTGELVQRVRGLKEDFRSPRVREISKATHEMLLAIERTNVMGIKSCMNTAQKNLAELGVSTPTIDRICKAVQDIDGAAKLSGAGGGGTVVCYHEDKLKLKKTVSDLGFQVTETILGDEGVRKE